MECPVFGISRHRIATDGEGVTTLVAFHRCTLHCHYCLNPQSLDPTTPCQVLTPEALLDATLIDNLYFLATAPSGAESQPCATTSSCGFAKSVPPNGNYSSRPASTCHVPT